jgi:flagellum-specific peptidoglycan hydrolase FlgJ
MIKLKIFFIVVLSFLYSKNINCGHAPISPNLLFEAKKIAFYSEVKNKDFSEELLKECIYYERIQHPNVVLKQAQLETGYYTSELFWVANNVFGMRLPEVRKTTAVGIYDHHARYDHWTDSVKDYKLFQDWYMSIGYDIGTESNDYLVFLKWIKYATDKKYISKLIYLGDKEIS